jgi:hypothetical protein
MVRFVFMLDPGDVVITTVNSRWRRVSVRWALAVSILTSTAVTAALLPAGLSWVTPQVTGMYAAAFLGSQACLFRYTWLALHDFHPRWAVVHVQGRWRGRRVRLRLDLDAASSTYRARRLLRPARPWHPESKITGLRVNAFGRGDIIAIGTETITFEQANRNLAARMARHAA